MRKRLRTAAVMLAAGSMVALAACGSDSTAATTAAPTTAAPATAAPSTAAPSTAAPATAAPATSGGSGAPASTGASTPASEASTPATGSTSASGASTPGSGASGEPCAAAKGKTVGYSEPLPDPNFKLIEDVVKRQLDKVGATFVAVNANLDPTKQIADVKSLQSQGINVLLINPVDPNAVQGVLDDVRKADIPIVVQDTKVGGPYFTNVTADVEGAAEAGAKLLKQKVGDGQVAAMIGPPFAEVLVREANAFAAAAKAAGLNVVDTQTNQTITPDAARDIATTWKQKYGKDLAGIWTFNDTSAVGAAAALSGDFKPVLVSINGQPEAIPLVKDGTILATYDLQQDMLGRALAFAAIAALCGTKVPADLWVENKLIDSSNVADWVSPADRGKQDVTVKLEARGDKTFVVAG